MKTIELNRFVSDFMEISNNLTHAELKMLYVLIIDPDVINLSQVKFAEMLGVDRRTIIFGYKKLREHGYLCDKNVTEGDEEKTGLNDAGEASVLIKRSNPINSEKFRRDDYEQKIFVLKEFEFLEPYFKDFPNAIGSTLTIIREMLPENIDDLARRLGFEEKLRIIRISYDKIKEYEKNKTPKAVSILDYEHKYWEYYDREWKKAALNIIYEVLIYLPLSFSKFMEDIRHYLFDDAIEFAQKMMVEVYGTDKI